MPKGVYVRTEIMRRNMSVGHMGVIPYIKGRHHTEIAKERMRLAHLGQKPTQKCIEMSRLVHTKNRECSVDRCQNKHEGLGFCKWHYNRLPHVREMMLRSGLKWRKKHPTSSNKYSYQTRLMMNNVRIRDNNTCQWQNCGKQHIDTTIHVHHIFPRSKYPELEEIERNMICYCVKHHRLWHQYRGDPCYKLISEGIEDVKKKEIKK